MGTVNEVMAITGIVSLLVAIFLIYLLPVIASWKLFKKAGIAGWKSLIPVYNVYLIFKISGMSGWWVVPVTGTAIISSLQQQQGIVIPNWVIILGGILGILAFIGEIIKAVKLPKAFGRGVGYTIGLIFLPNLFEIILGFDSSKYQGDYKE